MEGYLTIVNKYIDRTETLKCSVAASSLSSHLLITTSIEDVVLLISHEALTVAVQSYALGILEELVVRGHGDGAGMFCQYRSYD